MVQHTSSNFIHYFFVHSIVVVIHFANYSAIIFYPPGKFSTTHSNRIEKIFTMCNCLSCRALFLNWMLNNLTPYFSWIFFFEHTVNLIGSNKKKNRKKLCTIINFNIPLIKMFFFKHQENMTLFCWIDNAKLFHFIAVASDELTSGR
jgi:hypothetical protein